jgi:biopolymer transport protein ExbD
MAFGSFGGGESAPMAEINTTPLVDVMLVLLVVFIVTAPVLTNSLRVDLPQAKADAVQQPPAVIRLTVTAEGLALWETETAPTSDLAARFAAAYAANPQTELHLIADKNVKYDFIAQSMSAARNAGITRIGLLTKAQ